jgi:hypothetical protein
VRLVCQRRGGHRSCDEYTPWACPVTSGPHCFWRDCSWSGVETTGYPYQTREAGSVAGIGDPGPVDAVSVPRDQSSWSPLLLEGLPLKRGLKPTATHIKPTGQVGFLSLSHPLAERVMQCRAKRKLSSLAKCARDASSQTTVQSFCR